MQVTLEGNRVFIDFYAEWCGACQIMDQTTFADTVVLDVLEAGYVFVKVDTDKYPEAGKHFDVVGMIALIA
jgi:thiol:disulfide interchange protein